MVCLFIPGLEGIGVGILTGMLLGALGGAVIGGISGYAQYGVDGILPGIINGTENGMLIGGLFGGLGGIGALAGEVFGCSALMTNMFSISSKIAFGMAAFDISALEYVFQYWLFLDTGIYLGLVNPYIGEFISDLNHKAHSNPIYNAFQYAVSGMAAYSGGYVKTAACFVAGTLVATVNGLAAIETIKVGDYVLSTDPDTMKTGYKQVLETYIRKVDRLVHLIINDEEIITTVDHPFYVQGRGFICAADLLIGDRLIDCHGNILMLENYTIELTNELTTVYNFKVQDFHTYHVGENGVLVHNAGGYERSQKYSNNWSDESLSKTVDNIAPGSKPVKTASGKEIYNNPKTGKQVVYDTDGNYFRIEDTNLTGKRIYTDINGNPIPNNKIVNGKQMGISKSEYNQLTHFNNID